MHLDDYFSYIFHGHVQDLFVHIFVEEGAVLIDNCEYLFIGINCYWLYLISLSFLSFFCLNSCCVLKCKLHEGRENLSELGLRALKTLVTNQFLHDELFVQGDVEKLNR